MDKEFDVTVIGGGSAGLVIAIACVKLGKKTALIEKHRIGGDCLWTGCVPSKALLKSAKIAHYVREAEKFGIIVDNFKVDYKKVREHFQGAQKIIEEENDNPEKLREMGIDVILGSGKFENSNLMVVKDYESGEPINVKSKYFVISTGSRAATPDIPGFEQIKYLNSENIWDMEELPERLLIIGAGPIGIELGQAFSRLGSKVTIIQHGKRILAKEDKDVSTKMLHYLTDEGIDILLDSEIQEVLEKAGKYLIKIKTGLENKEGEFDQILVATGRKPNIESLNLEKIGVKIGKKGIEVNEKLQTDISNIYAAGDVIGHYQFTHVAAFQAQLIARNIVFPGSANIDYSVVPWATFCDPEIARCGLTEEEAREKHGEVDVFKIDFDQVDRAIAEGETKGFIKVIASKWQGKILGVHIMGPTAGEVIHEFVLAMKEDLPICKLGAIIHVYPTFSGIVWNIAGKWLSEGSLSKKAQSIINLLK